MSTVMGVVWYNAGMQPTIHPFSVPLIVTRVVGVLESIPPVIRLSAGDPSAFLPILSFTLNTFSPHFAEELVGAGLEVTGKTDLRFTDTLYKVLRDIFHYKPIVSKQQFLQKGFVQRKISTLCDIIHLVLQRDSELKKFSNIERRLSVMEVQIKSLLCSLKRLSALEDHLVKLTSRTNTENEEELITISRENWENLNVRILLLENKLEMAHTKHGEATG
ncbi:centrosomal protein of 44 kDa isoform X9 [Syngnathoides biaculeatus]|uniref:centrosomal protein of 44 kDa isoform X9 n=1 Tax=Syngnathoides biaculeatus TaxID=300417 RepID=UPI002ADE673A|nr:centrosomal protein of 44 kDa isoform X9 [Syngnathoides biaculeatus]